MWTRYIFFVFLETNKIKVFDMTQWPRPPSLLDFEHDLIRSQKYMCWPPLKLSRSTFSSVFAIAHVHGKEVAYSNLFPSTGKESMDTEAYMDLFGKKGIVIICKELLTNDRLITKATTPPSVKLLPSIESKKRVPIELILLKSARWNEVVSWDFIEEKASSNTH